VHYQNTFCLALFNFLQEPIGFLNKNKTKQNKTILETSLGLVSWNFLRSWATKICTKMSNGNRNQISFKLHHESLEKDSSFLHLIGESSCNFPCLLLPTEHRMQSTFIRAMNRRKKLKNPGSSIHMGFEIKLTAKCRKFRALQHTQPLHRRCKHAVNYKLRH
jgi:hypothetical protein